jgi:prepilin-type N-terminal cleavage/methylation domain-containing protein
MSVSSLRDRFAGDERGITMVEMLIVMVLMSILMAGIANVFVSGTRAQYDMNNRLNSQQNVRVALGRLEYEGRCATSATIVNSGAGVSFSLPSQCMHATGAVSWCVSSGILSRYVGSSCTGSAQIFSRYLTSATPFSLVTAAGQLPRLSVALVASPTGRGTDTFSITDAITLRNSPPS